jgi:hypothetical protein
VLEHASSIIPYTPELELLSTLDPVCLPTLLVAFEFDEDDDEAVLCRSRSERLGGEAPQP